MYEAILLPSARAARASLRDDERYEVQTIIERLEMDPRPDGRVTFAVDLGRGLQGVYDDGRWEIVYRVVDERFIEVIGINLVPG